ncbi:MAG: amidophosphoribosyltransferase [Bacteroidales bacterium]|nr:amidophosphoribosyltransferase [Bacteroidales bacterium]MBN2757540.1 amidophosphoribosyltransferase [Bacteroidales bacterium]
MNTGFFVNDNNEIRLIGRFIKNNATAFYHADYNSGGAWEIQNTIENMIWTFKNDVDPFPERLPFVQKQLSAMLNEDLPQILRRVGKLKLTICVVPRSKSETYYRKDQMLFRETISNVVDKLPNFENGTKYIIRHTNTRTTHLDRNGEGGDGNLPYPGITKNTCTISKQVTNRDILLIDDLYTKSVNIDEDAIQALFDNGAKSVTFYSFGKTVSKK